MILAFFLTFIADCTNSRYFMSFSDDTKPHTAYTIKAWLQKKKVQVLDSTSACLTYQQQRMCEENWKEKAETMIFFCCIDVYCWKNGTK